MKTAEKAPQAQVPTDAVEPNNGWPVNDRPGGGTMSIRREIDCDGICTLVFDRPKSSANVLEAGALLELDSHLDWIERTPSVRGVILWSAKETIFVAGADLHALSAVGNGSVAADRGRCFPDGHGQAGETRDVFMELIQLGQGVFGRLASLPVPTIAAIHGACVGGGFEMALACSYRMASAMPCTKIGLPETKLGIVPAWGGCTRLPRLIGIPRALDLILNGKTVRPEIALKLGIIDEVAPRERLLEAARHRILKPVPVSRPSLLVANNPVTAMLVRARTARVLAARTRGNYPAQFEALDLVTRGVFLPVASSLALEREAITRLARSETSRNLVRLFLAVQQLKKPAPTAEAATAQPIQRAAIVGAGLMGTGIAHWLSSRGLHVILRDVSLESLVRGMESVAQLYAGSVRRNDLSELEARAGRDRIFAAASDVPLRDVDVVVEAATETLSLKQDIFRCLAAQTSAATLLATNTSALSVNALGEATTAPERVVGLHFFNPVHRMELVEVVPGRKTSPEMCRRAVEFVRRIGKVPIVVQDSPGFVVNRVLMPYLAEAIRLLDSGVDPHEIDETMLDFGMPMGPLRLLDEIGMDVAVRVATTLATHYGNLVEPPALIHRMIQAGMTGRKAGRGFYEYPHEKPNHELAAMRSVHRQNFLPRAELSDRMSLLMVNEAARCVEERVAASGRDIDLAMVLGAGFAPFRGGPLRHADAAGITSIFATLRRLAAVDVRFEPCALLEQLASAGGRFYMEKEVHHENSRR